MKKLDKRYLIIIFFVLLFEIFICNFNFFKSNILDYKEIKYEEFSSYENKRNGRKISISLNNVNTKINNIYIDYEDYNVTPTETTVKLNYTDKLFKIFPKDQGSRRDYEHKMISGNEKSKYIFCDFKDKVGKLVFNIENEYGISINQIVLNKPVKFHFNFIRVILLITLISFIYTVFNKKAFSKKFNIEDKKQMRVLSLVLVPFLFLLMLIQTSILSNVDTLDKVHINEMYGKQFVLSLTKGKIDINDYDSSKMKLIKKIKDPYVVTSKRNTILIKYFDSAYYNGNFYLYYGILPAIILLVPYYIITNEFMSIAFATFLFLLIGSIFTVKLFAEIVYRYFKNIPLSLVMLLCTFVLFSNKILWVSSRTWTYELVVSAGYCFVMIGMYLFFKYLRKNKKAYLGLSSLFLALSVACRPPCIFASIFVMLKVIYDVIMKIKEKKITSKYIIKTLICVSPYFIVGILLMIYNYIRFHNIFEFGANYQLSVTDFRNFGYGYKRIIIGFFSFLFSPLKYNFDFPFISSESIMPEYTGYYLSLPIGGGYIFSTVLGILIFLFPFIYKLIKKDNKNMYYLMLISLVLGIFILLFDANKCGSIGRYMMDFSWLLNIVVVLTILFLYNKIDRKYKNIFINVLIFLIAICVLNNSLVVFSNENNLLRTKESLKMFYYIKHLICFWM